MILNQNQIKVLKFSFIGGLVYLGAYILNLATNFDFGDREYMIFGPKVWINFSLYFISYLLIGSIEWIASSNWESLIKFAFIFTISYSIIYYIQFTSVENQLVFALLEMLLAPWVLIALIRGVVKKSSRITISGYIFALVFYFISIVFNFWTFSCSRHYGDFMKFLYFLDLVICPFLFYLFIFISDNLNSSDFNIVKQDLISTKYKITGKDFGLRAIIYSYLFLISLDCTLKLNFDHIDPSYKVDVYLRSFYAITICILSLAMLINLFAKGNFTLKSQVNS